MNQDSPYKSRKSRKRLETYLYNASLYYLKRYNSTTSHLKQILNRKLIKMKNDPEACSPGDYPEMINMTITKLEQIGYLNDARYCAFSIRQYQASGKSLQWMKRKLCEKGIGSELFEAMLQEVAQENDQTNWHEVERENANKFCQKKKLGPYYIKGELSFEEKRKQMAKMVGAGFSFQLAKELIHDTR